MVVYSIVYCYAYWLESAVGRVCQDCAQLSRSPDGHGNSEADVQAMGRIDRCGGNPTFPSARCGCI